MYSSIVIPCNLVLLLLTLNRIRGIKKDISALHMASNC